MALNRKSQAIFLSIMLSIIVFILIVILSPVLKQEVAKSINTTNLNSSNSALPVANRATVIILDMGLFYFIGIMISASLAYVTGKKNIGDVVTAIMVFIVVSVILTPLKSLIVLARDSSHLDCTNAAITTGGKLACIAVDIWLFYFAVAAVAVGLSYIFMEKALPKIRGEE